MTEYAGDGVVDRLDIPRPTPRSLSALVLSLVAGLAAFLALAPASTPAPGDATVSANAAYGELPLAFEPNSGRFDPSIDFTAEAQSGSVALTDRGAVLSQTTALDEDAQGAVGAAGASAAAEPTRSVTDAIAVRFPGADLSNAAATDKLPGVVNDLRGEDPSKHFTNIATFGGVTYANVKPGVDLDFYGEGTALEYDFRLAAGVDPATAQTRIAGADDLHLNASGDLIATVGKTRFVQNAPVTFQPATAAEPKAAVESDFVLDGNKVSFALGDFDPSRALVIDPVSLGYSTYLGGDGVDAAEDIAVDASGAAYIAGETNSTDFNTVGAIEGNSTDADAFISKLNPAGSALEYSTYLGGVGRDLARGIAVDSSGAAYVAGETGSSDFDTVGGIEGNSNDIDAFVAKLTPAGSALAYSTYLGGDDADLASSIAVDSTGAAYVAGATLSTDFDTQGLIEGDSAGSDAFVSKITPTGGALAYSTYLGGDDFDAANGIAIDASGAAYVTGDTISTDFDTVGEIESDGASIDAFVSKLTPAGDSLAYSTYLGGDSDDVSSDIDVDPSGAAYVTGSTLSSDLDTVGPIEGNSTDADAFVSKLTPAGSALAYSTYLGGNAADSAGSVAVDASGLAYVTGETSSTDFDTVGGIDGDSTGADVFIWALAPAGDSLAYSTYLGGDGADSARAIAVDPTGAAYVTGETSSTDFDTVGSIEGDSAAKDAFVAKLLPPDTTPPQTSITSGPAEGSTTNDIFPTFEFTSSEADSTFECRLDDAVFFEACTSPFTPDLGLFDGEHTFEVRATDGFDNTDATPASRSFTVDTTAPDTTITRAPKTKTTRRRSAPVTFAFRADEAGSSFECSVDGQPFRACTSPKRQSLKVGRHVFGVRATDAAGNTDQTPARARVTVKRKKRR